MSNKVKSIGNIIATVFLVIVLLFAALITIMSFNAKVNDNIPSIFGYSTFSIQTDSMEGTINPGDFIIGEKCDPTELVEGDIISFHTVDDDGNYFINTHRIIGVNEDGNYLSFQTQGDNEDYPDNRLVAPGDIISKYTGVRLPLLGYVITFLSSQLGFFICIVFPVLLYTIWQVYKLIKVIMENQKTKILEEAQDQTSEELKQAIINEYLAKQKQLEQQSSNQE
jgi:signal peptidase